MLNYALRLDLKEKPRFYRENSNRRLQYSFAYLNEMELDVFITETLKSIFKGIKDAQPFAKENGGRVNPIRMQASNKLHPDFNVYFGDEEMARPLTIIEFDVAVTASSQKNTGIGGGINVLSMSLKGKDESTNVDQSVSRIKFLIGVSLPHELK